MVAFQQHNRPPVPGHATAVIESTIIGQADTSVSQTDLVATFTETGTVETSGANNLVRRAIGFDGTIVSSDDPMLGPLMSNGGPTATHALSAESSGVDQGVNPLSLTTDQRGVTYARVSNGIADIGAFERQATGGPALPGDYNGNSVVDTADYVVWRNTQNTSVASYSGADGNGDGEIDAADHAVWRANFGRVLGTAVVAEIRAEGASLPDASPAVAVAPFHASSSAAATARDAALVSVMDSERPFRLATRAKIADISPQPLRPALELVLIGARDTAARTSRDTAGDLPREADKSDDALDARTVDALLADWPAAISRDVSF